MIKHEFAINVVILSILIVLAGLLDMVDNRRYNQIDNNDSTNILDVAVTEPNNYETTEEMAVVLPGEEEIETEPYVFENMTMEELTIQLDKSLHSDLTGTGYLYAKYAIKYNVDPFLAVAISLHESGCNSTCSEKVTVCNNVGGQKFSPTCYAGGSYGKYDSLEEGIEGFIANISNNYIQKGLTTPEAMQLKYVGNNTSPWASKVNKYIEKIRNA